MSRNEPKQQSKRAIPPALFAVILCAALAMAVVIFVRPETRDERPRDVEVPAIVQMQPAGYAADLDRFYDECIRHTLDASEIFVTCQTVESIQDAYKVDAMRYLDAHLALMIETARRVERGDFLTQEAYDACVARGECALIPLIPENQRERIGRDEDLQRKSRLFWHLIDRGTLTAGICSEMEVCQALYKIGLVDF